MSNVTARMVAELREITSLGMMECKKALVETAGDIKKAEELLRIKSGAKAGKLAGRIAAEGIIVTCLSDDGKSGALVEVNSETDFVAKDESFVSFANVVAQTIVDNKVKTIDELTNTMTANGQTIEEIRKEIIAKLGENISVRRIEYFSTTGKLAVYLHGKKIGVIVDMDGGDAELGRDIAMHIAASKPLCISRDNVPSEKINTERKIYSQQALDSGKSAEIIAKMVDGRINKFLAEVTLLGQQFVKNPDVNVEKLLTSKNAKINAFAMFIVGEGIERKEVDFVAEVAAVIDVK